MNSTIERTERKAKKSFTLSLESVKFLENARKTRRASSVSSVLEDILLSVRREQERASLDRAMERYYDSLTDEEVAEDSLWGEVGLRALALEDKL